MSGRANRAKCRLPQAAVENHRRSAAVAFTALLLLASGAAPALAANGGTATTGMQVEAWYATVTSDACESPADLDCSQLPPVDQYPKDTLHVGVHGGKPTALTVVEVDLFGANIPAGMQVVGGTLSLPVDTAPSDGSLGHENAKLLVCGVTEFVSGGKAQLKQPPKTECDNASAPAKYSAKSKTFTVDLQPFAAKWAAGDSPALAVMPAPEAATGNETWHVAFWGKDYGESDDDLGVGAGDEEPKPITAKLKYEPKAGESTTTTLSPLEPSVDLGGPPELGEVAPPPEPEPELDLAAPKEAEQVKAAPAEDTPEVLAESGPSFRTVGYMYPIAWLMPLLLLIGFAVTGRTLTKKMEPTMGTRLNW